MDYELRINPQYDIVPEIETHNLEYIHGNVRIFNNGLNTIYLKNIEILLHPVEPESLTKQYNAGYKDKVDIIHPEKGSIYSFHIEKNEFATEKYLKAEKFFGVVCNVLFRV